MGHSVKTPAASAAPSTLETREESCLSDEDLIAFALGRLESERLPEAHHHLDVCETCQRLLSEAAHELGTAATAPLTGPLSESDDTSWNTMFQPGAVVGRRYLIRHFIARGGMGEVYEAFDRDLQQRVALKTVTSTACDNPRAVRRLKGEVQLARRVSHPNVCRIYDLGSHLLESGAQIHFLTMEFVEGETLGQRVRLAGALPIEETRRIVRQLLLGLSAAHDAGILHRDFKSDNVMLRAEPDGQSTALILDFGLARALDHDSEKGVSASHPTLVGTFGYIAPEQIEAKPLSTASDLYSFGVVWFEMLTGQLPFDVRSSRVASALERLHRPPPAPSRVNAELPRALDAVVLRCLNRSPEGRFQRAGEVLSALDALDASPQPGIRKRNVLQLVAAGAGLCGIGILYGAMRAEPRTLIETTQSASSSAREHRAPAGVTSLEADLRDQSAADASNPIAAPVELGPTARESGTARPSSQARSTRERPVRLPPLPAPGASAGASRDTASGPASAAPSAAAPSPVASSSAPANAAPTERRRRAKPDWENPFGPPRAPQN